MGHATPGVTTLDMSEPVWDHFFTVAPLILVGTRDPDGTANIAPKHMATALGWDNYYGFVCSSNHRTQQNIVRHGSFTVSFVRPYQLVVTNLAASPRWLDDTKPGLASIPTRAATAVDGVLVENCYSWLECRLEQILDGFGTNSLIVGRIVAASVADDALRTPDRDDADLIEQSPMFGYLHPGRFFIVGETIAYPFPPGFSR
jgi:flavin reductase (DIM6/NTAB) family NADH-FMN oxidoreductase RutF